MAFCSSCVPTLLWLGVVFLATNVHRCDAGIVVRTKYGDILGKTQRYPDSDNTPFKAVHKFLGVPYASPPVGRLRFQPPRPPSAWKPNIFNATQFGKLCIQPREPVNERFMRKFLPQPTVDYYSEDCLFLNIFTPIKRNKTSSDDPSLLPVMFYIHGGGYEVGTSLFAPGDMLALKGVVVVAIQYRLSTFGFVTTGDSAAPGNYGMLDQVQALKWVKENIASFGGNSSHVTIFGESAGGSSVCLHLLSPLSRDLVHQAIAMSGVDLSHFAYTSVERAVKYTKYVARMTGCPDSESSSMIKCLRTMKSSDIPVSGYNTWRPVVDNHFLTSSPGELRKRGEFLKIPFIAGFTDNEGAYFNFHYRRANKTQFRGAVVEVFKTITNYELGLPGKKEIQKLIMDAAEFQYTPRTLTQMTSVWGQRVSDIVTDFSFAAPTHKVLAGHTRFAPGYMYVFQHTSRLFNADLAPSMKHLDDTPYMFGYPFLNLTRNAETQPAFDDTDRDVSDTLITLFTNFAKYGSPSPRPVRGAHWGKFNSISKAYWNIRAQPEMRSQFFPRRMAFWNEYYPQLLNVTVDQKACPELATPTSTSIGSQAFDTCAIPAILAALVFYLIFLLTFTPFATPCTMHI